MGFGPVHNLGACVERVLEKADSPRLARVGVRSVLFPLMGTGTARGSLERKARELLDAAVAHFANYPASRVERVYFLNWTKDELDVCTRILQQDARLQRVASMAGKKRQRAGKARPRRHRKRSQ